MSARELARRILSERATPARLAWAVALGVLIGTSPFFGFHLVLCLVAATLLGLNRAVTYLAANISVPWTAPLLIFASVQIGTVLMTGRWLPLEWEAFGATDPWQFAEAWLAGAFVLGGVLGSVAGLLTFAAARSYRRRHPLPPDPVGEAIERTAARFRPQGRAVFGYVRGKLEHDPIYRHLAGSADTPQPVIDLGCGRGQTLVLLSEMRPGLRGVGIDWDESKLGRARQAAAGLERLAFSRADVRSVEIPAAGTLLLIDVLHYQDLQTQDELLRRAVRALAPGGLLCIREVDAGAGVRARLTIFQERLGRLLRLNRGPTLCFRPAAQLVDVLAAEGLEPAVLPGSTGLPLSNVIIEARVRTTRALRNTAPGVDGRPSRGPLEPSVPSV